MELRGTVLVLRPLIVVAMREEAEQLGAAGGRRCGLDGIHDVGTVFEHDVDDEGLFALTGAHFSAAIVLGEGPALATGDRFVAGGAFRVALALRAELVELEGYAVVVAGSCAAAGVPVRIVKLVSDDAGKNASTTWADSVATHARALAAWAEQHLG